MSGEVIYNQSEILNTIKIFHEKHYENVDHELAETHISFLLLAFRFWIETLHIYLMNILRKKLFRVPR